jgi:hypothetical protein
MKKIFETPNNAHYFFGYYDKSPLNIDNTKLLACRSKFCERIPTKDDILEIGYFNWRESNKFIKLTETKAWNWQQSCMLQWFAPEYDKKIIYNDRVDNQFVTIILDIGTEGKDILPMAYYAMSSDGKFILCIDNERHYWYRGGYNYQGIENLDKNKPIDENDGIWHIDIKTEEKKQIITLKELLTIKPLSNMQNAVHYVEHLMISPNNKRFTFLHRWKMDSGAIYARLYTANIDGTEIYLLNDSGRMSHFYWKNNTEIVGWGGLSNPINNLRKYKNIAKYFIKPLLPIYHKLINGNSTISNMVSGDSYILFKDKANKTSKIFTDRLTYDGHPSFLKNDENIMITDIYPDKNDHFYQKLYICDLKTNEVKEIDRIKHNKDFANSGCRCDLHPKISYDGKCVCIDTLIEQTRGMSLYEIKDMKSE